MRRSIQRGLAAAAVAASANACAGLRHAINTNAIYGEAIANSSTLSASTSTASESLSGHDTIGGIGLQFSGINRALWFMHIGFNYGLGPLAKNGTATGAVTGSAAGAVSGHSRALNLRLGKAFRLGPGVLVGPYLAYQYAQFTAELGANSLSYQTNGVGGGFFGALTVTKRLTLLAHAGYLVGASGSASVSGTALPGAPSAGVLQMGAKLDYGFAHVYSLFIGAEYDRYSASYTAASGTGSANGRIQELRGLMGIAYHY